MFSLNMDILAFHKMCHNQIFQYEIFSQDEEPRMFNTGVFVFSNILCFVKKCEDKNVSEIIKR